MFGFKYGFGYGFTSGYSPLINYRWSSTYQANNQMYSKNLGTGTPLALYSGQGVKFNGVDQRVFIEDVVLNGDFNIFFTAKTDSGSDNAILGNNSITSHFLRLNAFSLEVRIAGVDYNYTIEDALKVSKYSLQRDGSTLILYVDDVLNEIKYGVTTSQITFSSIGTILESIHYFDGQLNDLFIFNRALTQTEITKYSTNPNGFFNDALVDDTCVLNMPLAENDKYCYDYANYNEGEPNTSAYVTNEGNGIAILTDDGFTSSSDGTAPSNRPKVTYTGLTVGAYYLIDINTQVNSGNTTYSFYTNTYEVSGVEANGVYSIILLAKASGIAIVLDGSLPYDITTVTTIKELTGIHEIQNYTDSCRDEAKQLPYGSQNANYRINNLGMRTNESPYFECSELFDNYGDTEYTLLESTDYTIYLTLRLQNDNIPRRFGAESFNIEERSDSTFLINGVGNRAFINKVPYNNQFVFLRIHFRADGIVSARINNTDDFIEGTIDSVYEATTFQLGKRADLNSLFWNTPIKHINLKLGLSTQEEDTKAYNKAVAQGLLI